ncbi:MAG: single-stranded-DNA-specific exonuclease RecJ [Patescibacteria group bacterium]|nr:single-stranded-DNA-specific exonuclease RecJ [Patescibacteria group bacterium]
MKKWEILNRLKVGIEKLKVRDIINILLENRGLKIKKELEEFLNPALENVTAENVGIDKEQLKKAVDRIKKAIKNKEKVIVFGDYDADGICGTAILWEVLHNLNTNVMPYIPHRIDEGYGLSIAGINNLISQAKDEKISLIITVDNGIVANDAVEYANKQGIDVIVTDHHVKPKKIPAAFAIIHTTKICGAGVSYILSKQFISGTDDYLELVAIAGIADMVPLTGSMRTLVKFGLLEIKKTKRPGILALLDEAGINPLDVGVYEAGHIIAPRLNASGRLEYAMEALRLLCTKDKSRAKLLAEKLGRINRERQNLTIETASHAKSQVLNLEIKNSKLLFVIHESYQQGVIGLVAGKLVDEFYRPTIVVSKGSKYSKASARSISGFNMIEFIRQAEDYLVDVGGHPMAAGFTVETEKLVELQKRLEFIAKDLLGEEHFIRKLKVDCELPIDFIDENLYQAIQKLYPFGVGNPEPTFISKKVLVLDMRLVGNDGKHLKLFLSGKDKKFSAIAFGMGAMSKEFKIGDKVNMVYSIEINEWNGNKRLQLKIKDIRI